MEFMKIYYDAIENAKKQALELEQGNAELEQKIGELNKSYESFVQELAFENAKKIKTEIAELQLEIDTKNDMITVLRNKKNQGILDAAKKVVLACIEAKEKLTKEQKKLIKHAEAKHDEYLKSLAPIMERNQALEMVANQLRHLEGVVGIHKDLGGVNPSVELSRTNEGKIPLHPFFIRSYEELLKKLSERR
jgi:chromosome segregation ATPase